MQDEQSIHKFENSFDNNQQVNYPKLNYMQQNQPPSDQRQRGRDMDQMQPPPPPMRSGRPMQPPFRPQESPEFEPPQPPVPTIAPPSSAPQFPSRQDVRGIGICLNRVTFIWLNNGSSFWFYPTFIGREAILGFRWRGFGWTYQRINRNRIRSFQCF